MEHEGMELPPLRWQRSSSRFHNVWRIQDGDTIVAVVDEVGDTRSWVFYWYRDDEWVDLMEFGSFDSSVEGILPQFGEIVEYAAPVNPSHACLMVREHGGSTIWWLLYYRVRFGDYLLMCAFQSRWYDVVVERNDASVDESSDESDESEFVQTIFDI
jgi:hypothetical protein